jgi:hypothetical protein
MVKEWNRSLEPAGSVEPAAFYIVRLHKHSIKPDAEKKLLPFKVH